MTLFCPHQEFIGNSYSWAKKPWIPHVPGWGWHRQTVGMAVRWWSSWLLAAASSEREPKSFICWPTDDVPWPLLVRSGVDGVAASASRLPHLCIIYALIPWCCSFITSCYHSHYHINMHRHTHTNTYTYTHTHIYIYILVGGLEHLFFSIYWECHHPNWLIFFRGVETTNQTYIYIYIYTYQLLYVWGNNPFTSIPAASRHRRRAHVLPASGSQRSPMASGAMGAVARSRTWGFFDGLTHQNYSPKNVVNHW